MSRNNNVLAVAQIVFNKLVSGANLTPQDIRNLIFDENFSLPNNFLTSTDFDQMTKSFDFNGSGTVDVDDFNYLVSHISDLKILLKIVQMATLVVSKFKKLTNIDLSSQQTVDAVLRMIVYCIF